MGGWGRGPPPSTPLNLRGSVLRSGVGRGRGPPPTLESLFRRAITLSSTVPDLLARPQLSSPDAWGGGGFSSLPPPHIGAMEDRSRGKIPRSVAPHCPPTVLHSGSGRWWYALDRRGDRAATTLSDLFKPVKGGKFPPFSGTYPPGTPPNRNLGGPEPGDSPPAAPPNGGIISPRPAERWGKPTGRSGSAVLPLAPGGGGKGSPGRAAGLETEFPLRRRVGWSVSPPGTTGWGRWLPGGRWAAARTSVYQSGRGEFVRGADGFSPPVGWPLPSLPSRKIRGGYPSYWGGSCGP